MELIRPGTHIDFVGQSRLCGAVSVALVALSLVLMLTRQWNLGIDFAGGTVVQVQVPEEAGAVDEGSVRKAMAAIGYPNAVIVRFGSVEDRSFRINVRASQAENRDLSVQILSGISEQLGVPVKEQLVESVGPRVGRELRSAGFRALLLSWLLILIYVWFRFDLRYAPGAVVALIHDVMITAGVFVGLGLEFNLQILAALLVVVGYSLNDTIVIYDRIRENFEERGKTRLEEVVNQSINQTLSRTLLTSATTLLVVTALLLFGGPVLRGFSVALLIGVSVGTYSTIYVASALLILLERRFGGGGTPQPAPKPQRAQAPRKPQKKARRARS